MGLPWVRLDTNLPYNPKVLALLAMPGGHRAAFVYVCSLTYTGSHGLDGFLPADSLPFLHGRVADARLLLRVGLWRDVPGGYQVPDWAAFQLTSDEQQERRRRAQAAAAARWHRDEGVPA